MKTIKTYIAFATVGLILVIITVFLLIDRRKKQNQLAKLKAVSTGIPYTSNSDSTVLGADISHWDGEIDWLEVKKSGIKFLFIKATQGAEYIDPDFDHNWSSADNYGFYRGAYHFYDPKADPKAQAAHFLSVIKPQKGDLLPVLDIEISEGVDSRKLSEDIAVWIKHVYDAIGRNPILYTDKAFWERAIDMDFSRCPLWIAEWEQGHSPYLPTGWKEWVFWQYSETGTINGMPSKGKIDLDRFNGNLEALKTYQIR